jgi:hypothetical protein
MAMGTIFPSAKEGPNMHRIAAYFPEAIINPSRTFKRIVTEKSIVGVYPVMVLGVLAGITYFVSFLYGAVGGYEPYIPIPKAVYRFYESFFILPLYLAVWTTLSVLACFFARRLGSNMTLKQSMNILGFSYFVPLLSFVVADFFLIGPAYSWKTAALAGFYGPVIQAIMSIVDILYVAIPFGLLAPAYTFIAVKEAHSMPAKKALAITVAAVIPASLLFGIMW